MEWQEIGIVEFQWNRDIYGNLSKGSLARLKNLNITLLVNGKAVGTVHCSYEASRVLTVMKNFASLLPARGRESDLARKCDGSGNAKTEFCPGKANGKTATQATNAGYQG